MRRAAGGACRGLIRSLSALALRSVLRACPSGARAARHNSLRAVPRSGLPAVAGNHAGHRAAQTTCRWSEVETDFAALVAPLALPAPLRPRSGPKSAPAGTACRSGWTVLPVPGKPPRFTRRQGVCARGDFWPERRRAGAGLASGEPAKLVAASDSRRVSERSGASRDRRRKPPSNSGWQHAASFAARPAPAHADARSAERSASTERDSMSPGRRPPAAGARHSRAANG